MLRPAQTILTLTLVASLILLPKTILAQEDKEKNEKNGDKIQLGLWCGLNLGIIPSSAVAAYGTSTLGGFSLGFDGFFLASRNIGLGLGISTRSFLAWSYSIQSYSAKVNAGYVPILAELRFSIDPVYFQVEGGYAFLTYSVTVSGNTSSSFPTADFSGPAVGASFGLRIPFGNTFGLEFFAKYLVVFGKLGFYTDAFPSMGITPGFAFSARF